MLSRLARNCLCILACWAFESVSRPAQAAEWSLEPSLGIKTEYTDNIQFAPGSDARSAWGIMVSPDVRFGGATETLTVVGGLNASFNRYPNQPEFDIDNYAFTLRSGWKVQQDTLALNVDAIRDSTLVTELETTGTVLAYSPRNSLNVNPSWIRQLTDRMLLDFRYSYRAADYDDTAGTSLTSWRDQSASVGLQWAPDERSALRLEAYYDKYSTDSASFRARTYGIQAGYNYAFSETFRAGVTAGLRRTHGTTSSSALVCDGFILLGVCFGTLNELTTVVNDDSTGYTVDAFLERRTETMTVGGRLSRQIYPSGVGSLVQTDRFAVSWTRRWVPILTVALDAAAYQTRYVGSLVGGSDSRYYRIEPRLSWRMTEDATMNAGFSYARQKYEDAPVTATANLVYVSIVYKWPKASVSR
jgi:hypothetical protein